MITQQLVETKLSFLQKDIREEITKHGVVKEYEKGAEIIKAGQYIKSVPLLVKGLIKVFCHYEDKELLLYYLKEEDSCIMNFSTSLADETSKVFAIAEQDSIVYMLPVHKVEEWTIKFPQLTSMFFQQYNQRYSELLSTIKHLLVDKMDERIHSYLSAKATVNGDSFITITHKEIAQELGTAREVVSRMTKKLEQEGYIKQHSKGIELIEYYENEDYSK